jgi:hypothetical protein
MKVYRKIRHSLFNQVSTGKYLKYALGEILLVMIGILLALQVNNWNTRRIDKQVEKKVLLGLKESLQSDLENTIESNLKSSKTLMELVDSFLDEAKNKKRGPKAIRFDLLARDRYFDANTIFLEILQSKGVDIITNETLKLSIINIYILEYKQITRAFENEHVNLIDIYRPTLRRWFDISKGEEVAEGGYLAIDYEGMMMDRDFINVMTISYTINKRLTQELENLRIKVEETITAIDNELAEF